MVWENIVDDNNIFPCVSRSREIQNIFTSREREVRVTSTTYNLTFFWGGFRREFAAQSSNLTLSSSSHLLCRRGRNDRSPTRQRISPRENTLLRNRQRPVVLVCQQTEILVPLRTDSPASSVASHPSPAALSLSLDHGSLGEGRSQLSNAQHGENSRIIVCMIASSSLSS